MILVYAQAIVNRFIVIPYKHRKIDKVIGIYNTNHSEIGLDLSEFAGQIAEFGTKI